ncbi:rootletin isoform X3 [Denticeps clupeoides]|uniref:rootletin isoform X3 n=1 Tax=Denticeps clupeoides TaxID=299321 RepID=UPI0010A393D3|nr:rootletin-like isoform X3 [Denticeps clupeoides]
MNSEGDEREQSDGLEAVIKKLEDSLLHPDSSADERSFAGEGLGSPRTPLPAHIHQIVTRNPRETPTGALIPEQRYYALSNKAGDMSADGPVQDENRMLRDLLSQTCSDRDQLMLRQAALTDRLEHMLALQSGESDQEGVCVEQRRLREEAQSYRLKLQSYQESQQRQAQLVPKLQAKVLHYKKRCGELEEQVLQKTSESERLRLSLQAHLDSSAHRLQRSEQEHSLDVQSKHALLEEEQKRCSSLSQVNALLREQLDQAAAVNEGLSESLCRAREDLEQRDMRLRKDLETSASRLGREQARVRALWRQAASLRSTFTQFRAFADRSLSDMRMECVSAGRRLNGACLSLEFSSSHNSSPMGMESSMRDTQLMEKLKETMQLQACWDAEKMELNSRVVELGDIVKHLREQNSDKDSSMTSLQNSLDRMELSRAEERRERDNLRFEIEGLLHVLQNIGQLARGDGDSGLSDSSEKDAEPRSTSFVRGASPEKDSILLAVQRTLTQGQARTQDLRVRLDAALEQLGTLRVQLHEGQLERRELDQRIQELQQENQKTSRELEVGCRDFQRCHSTLDHVTSEKVRLEKQASALQEQLDSQHAELEVARVAGLDVQRQRDLLRQQREDLERQLTRQRSEAERGQRLVEQLEEKQSDLRKELVLQKEALSQLSLQKEVLEDEKHSLTQAISKLESQNAEQELALTKLQREQAGLRDSLAKMAALSEGLANDKVDLSRILLKTEAEKASLGERRRGAELERASVREEVTRLQQELLNMGAEKRTLEASESHLQGVLESLEVQIAQLQREKSQGLAQHTQDSRQQRLLLEQQSVLRRELEAQAAELQRLGREREDLAKDKASLSVHLTTAQRKASGFTQELVALRVEKEALESAVFESQEQVSALEGDCSRLEGEMRSLVQANDTLTRELARLQTEAEQQSFSTQREKQDLEGRLAQAERNTQLSLNSAQQSHLQQLETERRDKEQLCAELTAKCEQIEKRLRGECEDLRTSSQVELQHLQEEMRRLQQDCNAQLLQAENLKQQALSEVEVEKACLSEKLLSLHQEMEAASMETELMRRDFLSRQEQDKTLVCGLQADLESLRSRFEDSIISHESTEKTQRELLQELNQQKEEVQRKVEVLLRELQEAQEARDVGRKDLVQARRELRASSEERDAQRKEALELRRSLGDERREKEAVQTSNRELRGAVKRAESDNNSLKRAVEEKEQRLVVLEECKTSHHQETAKLRATLRELERSRLQARRELQELRRQVKTLEGEAAARTQELQELQARVTQEEQREEEAKREAFSLRQKLLESEAGREAALKESSALQRRVAELEDAERAGQEGLRQHDSAMQESLRRHHDETARLEGALHNAQTQVRELSLRVSLAEEQVQGLGQQLAQSEDTNRDLDQRLAGLVSALRRTLGIRQNGRSLNAGVRGRSLSPWKTRSPVKGDEPAPEGGLAVGGSPRSPSHMEEGDLDAESVRVALCNFQLELKDMQRDRVKPHTRYTHLTHLGKGGEITMEFREKRLGGLYVLFSCRDEGSVNPVAVASAVLSCWCSTVFVCMFVNAGECCRTKPRRRCSACCSSCVSCRPRRTETAGESSSSTRN